MHGQKILRNFRFWLVGSAKEFFLFIPIWNLFPCSLSDIMFKRWQNYTQEPVCSKDLFSTWTYRCRVDVTAIWDLIFSNIFGLHLICVGSRQQKDTRWICIPVSPYVFIEFLLLFSWRCRCTRRALVRVSRCSWLRTRGSGWTSPTWTAS